MVQLCLSWLVLLMYSFLCLCIQSFLTLSLENVAHHVKLAGGAAEAEKYIRDMVGYSTRARAHTHAHTSSSSALLVL